MSSAASMEPDGRSDTLSSTPPENTRPERPIAPQVRANGEKPVLWTAWLDYLATGEGRSIMACIAYANDEKEIQTRFGEVFDPWYAKGCDAQAGVVRNERTGLLWTEPVLDSIAQLAKRAGWVDAHSWMHFNLS
jgi:hypothetical protein